MWWEFAMQSDWHQQKSKNWRRFPVTRAAESCSALIGQPQSSLACDWSSLAAYFSVLATELHTSGDFNNHSKNYCTIIALLNSLSADHCFITLAGWCCMMDQKDADEYLIKSSPVRGNHWRHDALSSLIWSSVKMFNPFMPGGPKINLLFFDSLQLIAKKITYFMLPLLTRWSIWFVVIQ